MMNNKSTDKVAHFIGENGIGGVTVATRVIGNEAEAAFAFCSKRDRFNKKIGREKALGRLDSKDHKIKIPFNGHSIDTAVGVLNNLLVLVKGLKPSYLRNATIDLKSRKIIL
jgi:hypothetical protein